MIDLTKIPAPDVVEALDFESIYARRSARLQAALVETGVNWDPTIEADPLTKVVQADAYEEMLLRARVNDAARAVMLSALPVPHLDQTAESDANLLTRLGQDYDAVATVKEDRLIFTDRDGSNAGGQRLGTARIARSDGDRHSFKIAKREAVGSVKAKWRDLGNGATNTVEATADPEDERGPEGDAKATSKTLRGTYASEAEAHAAAAAELRRRSRGKRTLSLSLTMGRPDLIAGQPLRVSGFRPEIDTVDWLIDSLSHTLDERGLTTDLQAEEG